MKIIINNSSMVPIYEQLMEQIKTMILNEELKEDEILPSVRSLAKELKISALTVKKAYDNLEQEGFTVTVHGKGTYVAAGNNAAKQRNEEGNWRRTWKILFKKEKDMVFPMKISVLCLK